MTPLLILQHLSADGPGYLGTWLRREELPFQVCNSEAGDRFPASMDSYSGLAVLGGEMSANDPLPALRQAEALILQAMEDGKPVLGHCLGGQLMARALGARVVVAPVPEVGWLPVQLAAGDPLSVAWFGARSDARVMQWHYESFELPPGARLLAGSAACPNQAFAIGDRHLAMQFHVEADAEKVARWSHEDGPRYSDARARHPATVQDGARIRQGIADWAAGQQALADTIYRRWVDAITA